MNEIEKHATMAGRLGCNDCAERCAVDGRSPGSASLTIGDGTLAIGSSLMLVGGGCLVIEGGDSLIGGSDLVIDGAGMLDLGGVMVCGPTRVSRPVSRAAAARRIRRLVAKLWERMDDDGRAGLREFLKSLASAYEAANDG